MPLRQTKDPADEQTLWRDVFNLFVNGRGLFAALVVSFGAAAAADNWLSQSSMTEALRLAVTPLAVVVSMAIAAFALIAQLFKDEAPSAALAKRIGQSPLFGSAIFLFISGLTTIVLILVHVAVADTSKDNFLGPATVMLVVLVLLSASAHVAHLLRFLHDFLRGPSGIRSQEDSE